MRTRHGFVWKIDLVWKIDVAMILFVVCLFADRLISG